MPTENYIKAALKYARTKKRILGRETGEADI